jgi:hypothetical protein
MDIAEWYKISTDTEAVSLSALFTKYAMNAALTQFTLECSTVSSQRHMTLLIWKLLEPHSLYIIARCSSLNRTTFSFISSPFQQKHCGRSVIVALPRDERHIRLKYLRNVWLSALNYQATAHASRRRTSTFALQHSRGSSMDLSACWTSTSLFFARTRFDFRLLNLVDLEYHGTGDESLMIYSSLFGSPKTQNIRILPNHLQSSSSYHLDFSLVYVISVATTPSIKRHTTHMMPHLPAEIWAAIFAHDTTNAIHIWCNFRSISRNIRADVHVYFTRDVIKFYMRVAYWSPLPATGVRWCDGAKFLHYSSDPDRRLAYFDLLNTEQTVPGWDRDQIFVKVVRRGSGVDEAGGKVDVLAWRAEEEERSVLLSRRFPVKTMRGTDANVAGIDAVKVLVEINLEKRTVALDWQEVLGQIVRNGRNNIHGCVWGEECVAAISG